jgi:hypothetical protein
MSPNISTRWDFGHDVGHGAMRGSASNRVPAGGREVSLFSFERPCVSRALPYKDNLWPGIIFFAAITGIGLWYGGWWTWQNHLFAEHGQQMEATVLRKYMAVSRGRHGPSYTPHVAYGYRVGDVIINCDTPIQRSTWDEIDGSGGVPIKFLPEDPPDSRIDNTAEDWRSTMKGYLGLGGGLLALVFGVSATVSVHRRKTRVERLRARGLTASGRVTAVDTEQTGKQVRTFLRFEFTDNQGRVILGRSLPLTSRQERLWTQDKAITVFNDPSDSSVFTVNPNLVMTTRNR